MALDTPAVKPLQELTGFAPWLETEAGQKKEGSYKVGMMICQIINLGPPVLLLLSLLYTLIAGGISGFSFAFGLFWVLVVYIVLLWLLKFPRGIITNSRHKARVRYAEEIAASYAGSEGLDYFNAGDPGVSVLCWSPKGYAYLSPMSPNALTMPIANLCETRLEHVQLGSTTITNTTSSGSGIGIGVTRSVAIGFGGGRSKSKSQTTVHYEWRMDMVNDFDPMPSFTFVFPDQAEPRAKTAYAALSAGKKRHDTSIAAGGASAPAATDE